MKNKAERRHSEELAKESAKRVMKHVWHLKNLTPKKIGRAAAVHNRGCGCYMCQGSNRYTNGNTDRTLQEVRADDAMTEALKELAKAEDE